MKKFFFFILFIAVFPFSNNIKANTTHLVEEFDIGKENKIDSITKLLTSNGYNITRDDTKFYEIELEKGHCHIWLHYTPSSRYVFQYDICKDTLNQYDFLDGPRQVLDALINKYGKPDCAGIPYHTEVKNGITEYELKEIIYSKDQVLDTLSLHYFVKGIYSVEKFQYVWKNEKSNIIFRCIINDRIVESQWKKHFFYYITNENLKSCFWEERKQIEDHNKLIDTLKKIFYMFLVCVGIAIPGYFAQKKWKKELNQAAQELEESERKQNVALEQYRQYTKRLCDKYGTITRTIELSCLGKDNIECHEDIIVFQQSKIIVFGKNEYNFDDVLSCSMYDKNEKDALISQITRTKTGSMLGRAAVGALTFGVAGAVVGAVTAKKESTSTLSPIHLSSYVVKIGLKSVEKPVLTLVFGSEKSKAEEVYALMQAIIAMK